MFTLQSPVQSFIATIKGVLFSPVSFFRSVAWNSVKLVDSIVFFVILLLTTNSLHTLIELASNSFKFPYSYFSIFNYAFSDDYIAFFIRKGIIGFLDLVMFFLISFFAVIIVRLRFKRTLPYSAYAGVFAAISSVGIVGLIPIIGLFTIIYGLILTVIALRELVKLSLWQAIAMTIFLVMIRSFILSSINLYLGPFIIRNPLDLLFTPIVFFIGLFLFGMDVM